MPPLPLKTELGLTPRLIAAGWFAAAACFPIIFFFAVFARGGSDPGGASYSKGIWFFVAFPVSLATFFGFTIGCRILDEARKRTASGAILLGMAVAVLSYLGMPAFNLAFGALLLPTTPSLTGSFPTILGWILLIYVFGAIYVGWLILISGAIAGLLLLWVSRQDWLRKVLTAAPRVSRRSSYLMIAAALIVLVAANAFVLLFPHYYPQLSDYFSKFSTVWIQMSASKTFPASCYDKPSRVFSGLCPHKNS